MSAEEIRKVVINDCHGGFGLSEAAVVAYAARKGLTLYPELSGRFASITGPTYWTKPPGGRGPILAEEEWHAATAEQRIASNAAHEGAVLTDRDIPRDDPDLVAVVEDLGAAAGSKYAKLRAVEIPADVEWEIEEYDGLEWVAEKHRTWS